LFFISFLVLSLSVGLVCWVLAPGPAQPIEAAHYPWRIGMSEHEVDSVARTLLAQMSLEEKLQQLHGDQSWASQIKRRWRTAWGLGNRPAYVGYQERLHIPPIAAAYGSRGAVLAQGATCFPVPMARAATWDVDLEKQVGAAIAQEARAAGANFLSGPDLGLLRHPAWGRAQECYGEDPCLTGLMGAAWVQGLQAQKVMPCMGHLALGSQENKRSSVEVKADERTLQEVYLPPFRQSVEAGAAALMCAPNSINGKYCTHDHTLLTDLLRRQWGFGGIVSSDWRTDVHSAPQSAVDLEMPRGQGRAQLAKSIRSGQMAEAALDERVLHVLRAKLWHLTRPEPSSAANPSAQAEEHRALARRVAEQSMVLLKNEEALLPLDAKRIKKLAVIGPLATARNLGDPGSSAVYVGQMETPLDALLAAAGQSMELVYEPGINSVKAARVAADADAVLVFAGYRPHDEGENTRPDRRADAELAWGSSGDRPFLRLREDDELRIQAVTRANARTAVVVYSGSAVVMEGWQSDVQAILMAWYPGMEGSAALAQVLFGKSNPCGKLPFSIAHSEAGYPWFHAMTDTITYGPYHGYTHLDKKAEAALFPFGFGLGYTSFQSAAPLLARSACGVRDTLGISVTLANTGTRAGAEVVQLYVGFDQQGRWPRPEKLLRGFQKVQLRPGESRTLHFLLPVRQLAVYDPQSRTWVVPPGGYRVLTGTSSRWEDLQAARFQVLGE
ncbi:MAG TPA: glycoside hydrolase family 3 C-terminal domain-containing protein, partial [Saprospiraceae bacterium]|nr:glycoside hydrolase family 3 C-terminal domain-containing protein [Saprospiraceae bacterium]